jgi:peptide-methionine (R)-S-oxide reductase
MSDKRSESEWREKLTPEEFRVSRQKGTEPAFTGKYVDCKTPGIYRCTCCGSPLFDAAQNFDSGSGWPSYWSPIEDGRVAESIDTSHGMRRVEVLCAACDAHLGHVFEDGPQPTGLRYCINSVSLKLDPEDQT